MSEQPSTLDAYAVALWSGVRPYPEEINDEECPDECLNLMCAVVLGFSREHAEHLAELHFREDQILPHDAQVLRASVPIQLSIPLIPLIPGLQILSASEPQSWSRYLEGPGRLGDWILTGIGCGRRPVPLVQGPYADPAEALGLPGAQPK